MIENCHFFPTDILCYCSYLIEVNVIFHPFYHILDTINISYPKIHKNLSKKIYQNKPLQMVFSAVRSPLRLRTVHISHAIVGLGK